MSDDTERTRLPRGPAAPRLGPGERSLKESGADLQNGWLARHGTLTVTDDRLLFVPTVLDTVLRARRREIPLDSVREVERWPISPGGFAPGGRRPRMRVHAGECVYELLVSDLDGWIDALELVYTRRGQAGKPHRPRFTREGYTNLLRQDE